MTTPITTLPITGYTITDLALVSPAAGQFLEVGGSSDGRVEIDALATYCRAGLAWSDLTAKPTTLAGYGITDAQPLDSDLTAIAALTTTAYGRGFLPLADSAAALTYVGAAAATHNQAWSTITSTPTTLAGYGIADAQPLDADLTALAGLATTGTLERTGAGTAATYTVSGYAKTLLDDTTAASARTTLGLGTIATQSSASVAITGGTITGITDLAVADGGTGSSTAAGARANLEAAAANHGHLSSAFAEWPLNNYNAALTNGITLNPTLVSPTVYAGTGFGTAGYTVPSGQGGLYYVEVYGEIVGSAGNLSFAQIGIRRNSTNFFRRQQINYASGTMLAFIQTLGSMVFLAEGDTVRPQFTTSFASGTASLQNASFLVHKMNSY